MLFTTRNFCPTGNPCSTMAMHPFGLMSTVYPFARSVFPPSSHSTVNSTREFRRSPARICSPRAFSANPSVLTTVLSLRSALVVIQPRPSAQSQRHSKRHTMSYNPPYPPPSPPSMELPLYPHQRVTSSPLPPLPPLPHFLPLPPSRKLSYSPCSPGPLRAPNFVPLSI